MAERPFLLYETPVQVSDADRIDSLISHLAYLDGRTVVRLSVPLTSEQRKFISELHPAISIRPSNVLKPTPHPLLNAIRSLDELILWEYIVSHHPRIRSVVDIGGNARRQLSSRVFPARNYRAPLVHCCKPILDQTDAVRVVLQEPAPGVTTCEHTVQQCECVTPDLFVSIHSLYYLTPGDVYRAMLRSRLRIMYAVVHNIFDGYGRLTPDSWYVNNGQDVQFYAEHNSHAYRHPSINWLHKGGAYFDGNTLAWASVQGNAVSSIYCFTIVNREIALNPYVSIPLPSRDVAAAQALGTTWVEKVGNYLLGRDSKVVVPTQALIRLKMWISSRPRTPEVWATASSEARRYLRDSALPDVLICESAPALVSLAMDQTTDVLERSLRAVADKSDTYARINRWLKFDFSWTWMDWARWASVTVGAGIATFAAFLGIRRHPGFVITSTLGVFAVWGLWRASKHTKRKTVIRAPDFASWYSLKHAAPVGTAVNHIQGVPALAALPPVDTLETIKAHPVAPGCVVSEREIPPIRDDTGLVVYGIINTQVAMPTIFNRSQESYLAMIRYRLTIPKPIDQPTFDINIAYLYGYWIMQHYEEIFGSGAAPAARIEWINSFPDAMRGQMLQHENARWFGDPTNIFHRSVFIKRELSVKISQEGYSGNRPRPIQAGQPALHLHVVSTVLGYQNHIKARLHPSSPLPWVLPTSSTPTEFGDRWDRAFESDGFIGTEDDGANWDLTMSRYIQVPHMMIMCWVCPDPNNPNVIEYMWGQMETVGYIRNFYKVICAAMMHSGDLHTWCLNSSANIGIKTFIRAMWLHRDSCVICERPGSDFPYCQPCIVPLAETMRLFYAAGPSNHGPVALRHDRAPKLVTPSAAMYAHYATMFASGDDSAEASRADTNPPNATFRRAMGLKLGIDLKCKDHLADAKYRTSFCSGYAWPTPTGSVFGPKLGRVLARYGWWVDPQQRTPSYLAGLLRGDTIGRLNFCNHIPFLRVLFKRVLELTSGVSERSQKRTYFTFLRNISPPVASDEVWRVLYDKYGLEPRHEQEYAELLNQVTTLPAIVNYAPLAKAIFIDALDGEDESSLF